MKTDLLNCRELSEAELDAVNGGTITMTDKWVPLQQELSAAYARSLAVLARAKAAGLVTKSGIMVGLGEEASEVRSVMHDLRNVGVDILTLGQYLRPSSWHLAVEEYIPPETFDGLRDEGERMGFAYVAAGPLVRSSYRAGEFFLEKVIRARRGEAAG